MSINLFTLFVIGRREGREEGKELSFFPSFHPSFLSFHLPFLPSFPSMQSVNTFFGEFETCLGFRKLLSIHTPYLLPKSPQTSEVSGLFNPVPLRDSTNAPPERLLQNLGDDDRHIVIPGGFLPAKRHRIVENRIDHCLG